MLIDMHVHTAFSGEDFSTTLEQAIATCRDNGISAILLAECDVVPDAAAVAAISESEDFPVFVGVDVDAADGRVIAVPQDPAAAEFVGQGWAKESDDFTVKDVIDVMNMMNGVVVAAHPYLDDGGPFLGDSVHDVDGLTGVEIACGVKRHMSNDLALEAAASMGQPTIGGSDTGPEGQRLGRFATMFADEIGSQDELVEALREGTFWAVEIKKIDPQNPRTGPRPSRDGDSRGGRGRGRGRGGGGRGRGGGGNRR